MAAELLDRDPEGARKLLTEARATSSAALGDLRDVVHGIHPPVLADRGLRSAIEALALDLAVPVEVTGDPPAELSAPVESAVYFTVAECLANLSKHAEATRAWVELANPPGLLRVVVGDDGHGGAAPGSGHRDAGGRATARGLRRHDEGVEPGWRADPGHAGGAVRLVLAEDHALLRDGLIRILEAHGHEIVAAVDHADSLDDALADQSAEGAVLDVRLPPTHTDEGLRAAVGVRSRRPGFPVMVLSQYVERIYARELLASGEGGIGYLLKDRVGDVGEFVDALGRVAAGGTVLDPQVVSAVMARQAPVERLTAREREVLALMAEGRSNAAIAAALFVTEKAVGKHTNNIFTKLDLPLAPDDNRRVLAVLAWLGV